MRVPYNYLKEQFADPMESYLDDLRPLIRSGEFTFGPFVTAFEKKFADSATLKALSNLPSREVLLAKVAGAIQAPIFGLVYVLSAPIRELVYALQAVAKQKKE